MDCLLSLSADSDDDESTDTSFYEYTKRWIEVVNRGGLFETNEVSYMLFRAIESTLQPHEILLKVITTTTESIL